MPAAQVALANVTLVSSASTVTFSSISGLYRDLFLVVKGSLSTYGSVQIRLNGSATGYTYAILEGNGGTAYAGQNTSNGMDGNYNAWMENPSGSTNNQYEFHLMDYSTTNKHKSALFKFGHAATGIGFYGHRWANTSAVTSMTVSHVGANWGAGTSLALYGVTA